MSSGAKITLMVIAAVLGLLAVYYGLIGRSDDPLSPNAGPTPAMVTKPATTTSAPAGSLTRHGQDRLARPADSSAGTLSESIDQALKTTRSDAEVAPHPATTLPASPPLAHDPLPPAASSSTPSTPVTAAAPVTTTAPAPAPTPKAEPTTYTVRDGDSMWTIAQEWLGDGRKWDLIAKANPLIDPARLHVGMKLVMPPRNATGSSMIAAADPVKASAGPAKPAPVTSARTHVVGEGESLTSIARSVYGDGGKWKLIFETNRATIGSDPDNLKVGMKLTIPATQTAAARN